MIDTYEVIANAYNAGVSEQFKIAEDMTGQGETKVLNTDSIDVWFDMQDEQVESIKIDCFVEGDHNFDEVFIGFESGLKISSCIFFDAYQELLNTDNNHTTGETNGFRVDYMSENGHVIATFNRSKTA